MCNLWQIPRWHEGCQVCARQIRSSQKNTSDRTEPTGDAAAQRVRFIGRVYAIGVRAVGIRSIARDSTYTRRDFPHLLSVSFFYVLLTVHHFQHAKNLGTELISASIEQFMLGKLIRVQATGSRRGTVGLYYAANFLCHYRTKTLFRERTDIGSRLILSCTKGMDCTVTLTCFSAAVSVALRH